MEADWDYGLVRESSKSISAQFGFALPQHQEAAGPCSRFFFHCRIGEALTDLSSSPEHSMSLLPMFLGRNNLLVARVARPAMPKLKLNQRRCPVGRSLWSCPKRLANAWAGLARAKDDPSVKLKPKQNGGGSQMDLLPRPTLPESLRT